MLLAELNVRHTRRHMPTRRVALGECFIPTTGPASGAELLAAIVGEFLPRMDPEQRELFPALLREARSGLSVPRIAMRYRLQTDTHGLDRSRHRILDEGPGRKILELDEHGAPDPQVIGAVMAAASLVPAGRQVALDAIQRAVRRRRPGAPARLHVRRLEFGIPRVGPPRAGTSHPASPPADREWAGVSNDVRWAMEVFGFPAGPPPDLREVQTRYRRLLRLAHPDHGGHGPGAADRIADLRAARDLLCSDGASAAEEPLR